MVTRDYLVICALEHSHKSVGYAFCKALGVLHLIGQRQGRSTYEEHQTEGLTECFINAESPMDKVFT